MSEVATITSEPAFSYKELHRPPSFRAEHGEDQPFIDQAIQTRGIILEELNATHQGITTEKSDITEQEKINLQRLKALLDLDEDDGLFVQRMDEIKKLLPQVFAAMKGLVQTPPHRNIDPVDHTINALSLLDTKEFSPEDRQAARAILLFHDVGKVFDPQDREHPRKSVEIAKEYLKTMGYSEKDTARLLQHIKWHDALGDLARRDGQSILDPQDVLSYFPSVQELMLHKAVVMADVYSIPGLKRFLPDIQSIYKHMETRLYAERAWVQPDLRQKLPFERIDIEQMAELAEIYEPVYFDDINIQENMRERRRTFEDLPIEKQTQIKKMIVQSALENDEHMLFSLKLTGRETDRTFVDQLERELGSGVWGLDNLRIAQEIINSTYIMWQLNHEVQSIDPRNEYAIEGIKAKLRELVKSATFLSAYQLEATHVTSPMFEEKIDENLALIKSDSGEKSHFEGDGVYTGILGSYRDWSEGKMYTIKIPLADSVPIMVNYNSPHAMANVLGELLDIKDEGDGIAVAHGLRQWRQCEYHGDETEDWKVKLLEELLGKKALVVTDKEGQKCVVMDTDKDAIIWGSLARALRIRRFIPLSELSKSILPEIKSQCKTIPLKKEHIVIEEPVDPYVEMANTVRTIKGVRAKDLPDY